MSRQRLSWWCTEQGRGVAAGCISACALGGVLTQWLPHTVLQKYTLSVIQLYRSGEKVHLSEELNNKYEKCLEILKVDDRTKRFLNPFIIYGFDLFSTGNTKTKYGSNLGIPAHFEYNSLSDVDENVKVNEKIIDWSSDAGRRLAKSLVLTENEKLFGISREIISVQNYKSHIVCIYPAMAILTAYGLSVAVNVKFNNYHRPRIVRSIIYSIIGCFSLGLYFLMKDSMQFHYERIADEELGKLGRDFIESGVSFYDKLSKRNVAIQELTAGNEMIYSRTGNVNFLLRQRSTPILTRKQYFESLLRNESERE